MDHRTAPKLPSISLPEKYLKGDWALRPGVSDVTRVVFADQKPLVMVVVNPGDGHWNVIGFILEHLQSKEVAL